MWNIRRIWIDDIIDTNIKRRIRIRICELDPHNFNTIWICRVPSDSDRPLDSRIMSQHLATQSVQWHLKQMFHSLSGPAAPFPCECSYVSLCLCVRSTDTHFPFSCLSFIHFLSSRAQSMLWVGDKRWAPGSCLAQHRTFQLPGPCRAQNILNFRSKPSQLSNIYDSWGEMWNSQKHGPASLCVARSPFGVRPSIYSHIPPTLLSIEAWRRIQKYA